MMYFLSNPSVYTLPGTWEAQPYVEFDPTYLILSATVVFATAAEECCNFIGPLK